MKTIWRPISVLAILSICFLVMATVSPSSRQGGDPCIDKWGAINKSRPDSAIAIALAPGAKTKVMAKAKTKTDTSGLVAAVARQPVAAAQQAAPAAHATKAKTPTPGPKYVLVQYSQSVPFCVDHQRWPTPTNKVATVPEGFHTFDLGSRQSSPPFVRAAGSEDAKNPTVIVFH